MTNEGATTCSAVYCLLGSTWRSLPNVLSRTVCRFAGGSGLSSHVLGKQVILHIDPLDKGGAWSAHKEHLPLLPDADLGCTDLSGLELGMEASQALDD